MTLTVNNLEKSFRTKQVLKGISFTCQSGVATGLLGRNGAGKTTTIRVMLGIISKDGGEVILDGKPLPPYYSSIGYLPEERGLYPKVKIDEQLRYFASLRGLSGREASKALDRWFPRLEMDEYRGKTFETLSKGNQQKIQLMCALLHDPKIVILDEPFSGLDPVNALMLKNVVMELISEGKLVLFSSHQMNFVEEFCEDIVMIHGGRAVLSGSLADIKRSYERNSLYIRPRRTAKGVESLVKNLPGVLGVEKQGEGVLLTLEKEEVCTTVLSALTAGQADVDDFHLVELSLNDIFIRKVGEEV